MPKAFPLEFRRDVVAVARKGEAPLPWPCRTVAVMAWLRAWVSR